MKIGFGQCLIDPGLVCAERTAPLQEKRDALERRTRPRSRGRIDG
jgi:hypothetical protein